jgi:hypothetical protein
MPTIPDTTISARRARATQRDWRCHCCFKLLGRHHDDRVLLRFDRHEYDCAMPVSTVCRSCGRMNTLLPPTTRG